MPELAPHDEELGSREDDGADEALRRELRKKEMQAEVYGRLGDANGMNRQAAEDIREEVEKIRKQLGIE